MSLETVRLWPVLPVLLAVGIFAGCSNTPKSPAVAGDVRHALEQAGLKRISVSQDREKGIVTLGGHVAADSEKLQAENIARSIATGQVVSDEIAVLPPGDSDAKEVISDLDKGIQQNVDAALLQNKMHDAVKFSVKNQVVTLTGDVDSQYRRKQAETVVASVPNVRQVVNDVQVKNQKATTTY